MLTDDTRVPLRVEVRDKQYKPVANAKVQARSCGPMAPRHLELTPYPWKKAYTAGEWTAEKPGTYVAEIIAGREQEEIGRDMLTFRREDGVAENFHASQNRELLEKLCEQTGGRYYKPDEASKLTNEISYSEAGITTRETRDLWDMPVIFLWPWHPRLRMAAAQKVGCGMKLAGLAAAVRALPSRGDVLCHYRRARRGAGLRAALQDVGRGYRWSLKKAGGDSNVATLIAPSANRSARVSPTSPSRPSRPMPWW